MMKLQRTDSNPDFTIDVYGAFAWVTLFSNRALPENKKQELINQGVTSAITIKKSRSDLPEKPQIWFGDPRASFTVEENGIKYEIRTNGSNPGLFLDHQITRQWLKQNAKDKKVLNLFSYTGSLGISAAVGGAAETKNIDLSKSATDWAKSNATLNSLSDSHQFIKGDVFDWMKRFLRKKTIFDIVISDPPSQSRSDELHFSTEKHLDLLHELCVQTVAPNGILITSINTETISENALVESVKNVGRKLKRKIRKMEPLPLPTGFEPGFRSMKGIRVLFVQ